MQGHIHPQAGLAREVWSCQQTRMLHSLVLKDVGSDPLKQTQKRIQTPSATCSVLQRPASGKCISPLQQLCYSLTSIS